MNTALPSRIKFKIIREDLILEILFVSLAIVPFVNLADVFWMFTDKSMNEWYIIHTPISIKFLKDIILIALIGALVFHKKKYSPWNKINLLLLIVILFFVVLKSLIQQTPLLIILSGIRWYLPLFLFPLFDQYQITKENIESFYRRFLFLIIAALPLQILQIFFSNRWSLIDGAKYSRASGFFAQPQPMSIFALFFLIIIYEFNNKKPNRFHLLLALISIALTKSAAGVLGVGSIFFLKVKNIYKLATALTTLVAIFFFPLITGRLDYWQSPLARFKIFTEVNFSHIVFGVYTNTCSTIQKIAPQVTTCLIPDSFLTTILGNLGVFLGLVVVGCLLCSIYNSKKYYLFPIFIIFLIAGSITEYFPLNILFPFIIGYKHK